MAVRHRRIRSRVRGLVFFWAVLSLGSINVAGAQSVPAKIVGANACAECHKHEAEVWKATTHFKTFRDMPRSKEARKIATKMKIKRIKSKSLCLNCHFTIQKVKRRNKAVTGISCEKCHADGKDYLKVHAEFSGRKSKQEESKSEAASRWKKSEAAGMIRPRALYKLAKNCYGCHVVPQEKLVNVGGHPAGSKFELVSWSQGEIRHNLWYTNGKKNTKASANRKRLMYVVGVAVELETALRAVGVATKKKSYAVKMAYRAARARYKMAAVAKAVSGVNEIPKILKMARSAGLKLNNEKALTAAADKIATETLSLVTNYDGSTFASVDKMIPGADKYKGKPAK